jgi:3-oxoacyl-[acyl-carrier-protein] synthase II
MAVYIKGIGNISPQKTRGGGTLLSEPCNYKSDRLSCLEPDYAQYIDPRSLRRMSRIIRMGVAASSMALKEAGIEVPDGINTGTSYGCLEDTETFLAKMWENKELALNPTPFIHSTHNTIGSQIALLIKCQGYNQTYTQRGFSFESALLDAILELNDFPTKSILAGGVDENTPTSHTLLKRFGIWRGTPASSIDLFNQRDDGTINGEGAAFFVFSGEKGNDDKVSIDSIATFYRPDQDALLKGITQFLESASLQARDIDMVLLGKCGDQKLDAATETISKTLFSSNRTGLFKHLCGEYPTASAFALWLGARMIQTQRIPDVVALNDYRPLRTILIYNPYFGKYHSLILLRAC